MYLSIIISRFSNMLFFVQKTGQRYLVQFDLQKYLADENVYLLFYGKSENKIWKQIKKSIGEQSVKQIKKVIVPLKPAFSSHWRKASKHLLLWKQYFQSNQLLLQQIIFSAKGLSGIQHFVYSKISVYLISDSKSKDKEINAWFSWTPKESFIVVEIPLSLKVPNNFFPLSVLAHEFFHLMLRKNKNLFLKINRIAKENEKLLVKLSDSMSNRLFLEELLISSFIPEGYLSEKYFNTKVALYNSKPECLLDWRKLIASNLCQTTKKYVDSNKQIDKKYIQRIIEVIKQNIE